MVAASSQAAADVSETHAARGATMRSTCFGFSGCAAGQASKPRLGGAARAPVDAHERAAAVVEPAAHEGQTPEQAAVARPAELPNVPAWHSEQTAALPSEYVPGEQGAHAVEPGELHVPGGHTGHADDRPMSGDAVPASQGLQEAWVVKSWNVPALQGVQHQVQPPCEKEPTPHPPSLG